MWCLRKSLLITLLMITIVKSAVIHRTIRAIDPYSYPVPSVPFSGGGGSGPGSSGGFKNSFGVNNQGFSPSGYGSQGGGKGSFGNTKNFGGFGGPGIGFGSPAGGGGSGGGGMMGASYMRSSSPYYNYHVMLD